MTTTDALCAFLPVAVTLVLVPGVNNLVVLRETVAHARLGGLGAVAGTSFGTLAWSTAIALGLGAVVAEHPRAFSWLQTAGATLLVASGVRGAVRVLRHHTPRTVPATPSGTPSPGPDRSDVRRASFRTAAVTSLANPRCPVTAVSVLPQFVAPGSAAVVTTLALGILWTLLAGAWNVVGVLLAHRSRDLLTQPRARRTVEGVSAAALVAVGLSVVTAA